MTEAHFYNDKMIITKPVFKNGERYDTITLVIKKDDCFKYTGPEPIFSTNTESPAKIVTGETFKCNRLYNRGDSLAIYGIKYSEKKFGTIEYAFNSDVFKDIEKVYCPAIGGARRNKRATKKARRNRRRYSRRR